MSRTEAFLKYAAHLKGFRVLPIYGGQSYQPQLNALRRGVHVVVGTPGRVIDHMNRGTLKLSGLTLLVLDEADEMLRMYGKAFPKAYINDHDTHSAVHDINKINDVIKTLRHPS